MIGKIDLIIGAATLIIRASGESLVAQEGDLIFLGDAILTSLGTEVVIQTESPAGFIQLADRSSIILDSATIETNFTAISQSSLVNPASLGDFLTATLAASVNQILQFEAVPLSGSENLSTAQELGANQPSALFFGGSGDDLIFASGGDDRFYGNAGIDTVDFAEHNAGLSVDLSQLSPQFSGLSNVLFDGIENLLGTFFDDTMQGTDGANDLQGREGRDTLLGLKGADVLSGGAARDSLLGGGGADLLYGGQGKDKLNGGAGDDVIEGGGSNDRLIGAGGSDVLKGQSGADWIDGGLGNDILIGGAGADVFSFTAGGAGRDTIRDFEQGTDLIQLAGLPNGFDNLTIDQTPTALKIVHAFGTIRLAGLDETTLTSSDFDFIL